MRNIFLYGLLAATMLSPTMAGAAETLNRPAKADIVTNPASLIEGTAHQLRERGDGSGQRGEGRGEGQSRWNRGSGAAAAPPTATPSPHRAVPQSRLSRATAASAGTACRHRCGSSNRHRSQLATGTEGGRGSRSCATAMEWRFGSPPGS